MIMEEEEGSMETGEHQVLIVPRVGNDGDTVRGAASSSKWPLLDPELGGVSQLHALIQLRIHPAHRHRRRQGRRPRAGVGRVLRIRRLAKETLSRRSCRDP